MLQRFLHVQLHLISALAAVTTVTAISLALRRASTATSRLLGFSTVSAGKMQKLHYPDYGT